MDGTAPDGISIQQHQQQQKASTSPFVAVSINND